MSTTRMDNPFKLVNNSTDLEQGRFYTVTKDGSFMKKQDGIESIPSKEWSEEALNKDNPTSKLQKFLNIVFSTKGLIVTLVIIVVVGVVLGLLPLILSKSKSAQADEVLNTTLLSTILKTAETTSVLTSQASSTLLTSNIQTTLQTDKSTDQATSQAPSTQNAPSTAQQTTAQTCIIDPSPKSYIPASYNSNSCPTSSIYMPKFLTLTTSYNFDYPILQTIVCSGSKFELRCPTNQVIHIYSSYYGIQSDTNTYLCSPSSSNHDICYFDLTYSNVTTLCESKNSCQMSVNVGSFGDPCIGSLNKQLFIQYQCVDSTALTLVNSCAPNKNKSSICPAVQGAQIEKYWCSPQNIQFNCSAGTVIKILCAFYGIDPNIRCSGAFYYGSPSACYSKSTYTKLAQQCNDKTSCTIEAETSFEDAGFSNVCQGYQNMLLIQWECVSSTPTTTVEIATTVASLPFCRTTESIVGACNTTYSPYEPRYIENSTTTYFSYPIYQQVSCQGSRLIIVCPVDSVIHIYSAYYGIQSYTSSSCLSSSGESPAMCYFSNAFNTISSTCENKNSCQLRATSNSLGGGDLCPSYQKQLVVQYQCVDSFILNSTINQCNINKIVPGICPAVSTGVNENTWCDGSTMSITCPSGQNIQIVCSFYGIHPTLSSCNIPSLINKPVCYFKSSQTYVKSQCDNKNSCSIGVFSTTFTLDPCSGLDKALYVQWRCS